MAPLEIWWRRLASAGPTSWSERCALLLLTPLSWVYGTLQALRARLYAAGVFTSWQSPVPVVAVGNLALGGTGKTPLVELLLRQAKALGFRPAVVSRGYGRNQGDKLVVVCSGAGPTVPVREAGDELFWLAERHPDTLVVACARRRQGITEAVARGADLILLDDGYQHLAVARDINLLLLDDARPFGNGRVFPAGLLREPRAALGRATHVLLTRADGTSSPVRHDGCCRYLFDTTARGIDGTTIPVEDLRGLRLGGLAGIADPGRFFAQVNASGLRLEKTLALGDHASYDATTLAQVRDFAHDLDALVTTEKDGVKLAAEALPLPCWQLRLVVTVEPEQLLPNLLATLHHEASAMPQDTDLLSLLVCPACHGSLRPTDAPVTGVACDACRLAFPVRDGIPVMLLDDAVPLEPEA